MGGERAEPFGLPKKEIITSSREISNVFKSGKRIAGSQISIFYKLYHDHESIRVAFTASKKIKRAVDRNRLKRLMRETFRLNAEELRQITQRKNFGLDIILSINSIQSIKKFSLGDIEKDFKQFLEVSRELTG